MSNLDIEQFFALFLIVPLKPHLLVIGLKIKLVKILSHEVLSNQTYRKIKENIVNSWEIRTLRLKVGPFFEVRIQNKEKIQKSTPRFL